MRLTLLCLLLVFCSSIDAFDKSNDIDVQQHQRRTARKSVQTKQNEVDLEEDDNDVNGEEDDEEDDGENFDDSNEDFLFDDNKKGEPKDLLTTWSNVDLCKDVRCKANQYCVIKQNTIAACVYKKEKSTGKRMNGKNRKSGKFDYGKQERKSPRRNCLRCPSIESEFLCGSDNLTYSSRCRLSFHNCIHETNITKVCDGFCPCPAAKREWDDGKKEQNRQRWSKYWSKVKQTKYNLNSKQNSVGNDIDVDGNEIDVDSVVDDENRTKSKKKCSKLELEVMKTRLLDWFPVVIADQKRILSKAEKKSKSKTKLKRKKFTLKFPSCENDVMTMFQHFDTNSDLLLTLQELADLENDKQEKCLKQYLDTCDEDNDKLISPYEWCNCFSRPTVKPCKNELKHNLKKNLLGTYLPQCDQNGFYKSMQCHSSSGVCWCVDKNGVEYANTRHRGKVDCEAVISRADGSKRSKDTSEDDDDDDDDDDDEDGNSEKSSESEGSGDDSNVV